MNTGLGERAHEPVFMASGPGPMAVPGMTTLPLKRQSFSPLFSWQGSERVCGLAHLTLPSRCDGPSAADNGARFHVGGGRHVCLGPAATTIVLTVFFLRAAARILCAAECLRKRELSKLSYDSDTESKSAECRINVRAAVPRPPAPDFPLSSIGSSSRIRKTRSTSNPGQCKAASQSERTIAQNSAHLGRTAFGPKTDVERL
jgi:hypothetical protein